ncbi:response regulator [Sinomicrobium weinanense]|uniref:Response regulator transcription factor n=1 Tax=Sinomicrobium weinanense TaxID=2842200 RepID=A0A926JSR5_9FLAO|nr:response regulator transcription factor [Sinomicrobium weinanense]MBC9796634.1 response regulator transcription factor [Sinomicrobium weinanense]MBU3123842.1 response regulator transcription factor [Sinomicrobium weinanense]
MSIPIKIALIDDESLFLEGLTALLSNLKEISVVLTAEDGSEFLMQLSNTSAENFPEVVLVDIQMKPINGFELVEKLKEEYPDLKIIILSSHYKNTMFGHMIKMGVSAFIPKHSSREELFRVIDSVYKTGVFFTPKDHQMLVDYVRNKSKKPGLGPVDSLSDREIEVIKLICSEFTNQEIADKLFISKRTVESHRQRILEKIGAKNTVGLVVYAIANEIYIPAQHFGSV